MTPSDTLPQLSLPGIRDPRRDYPFENLAVHYGTTPSNFNTSIQRPLARQRVMLSRRVIADYGLIRVSESLPTTSGFAEGLLHPRKPAWGGDPEVPQLTPWDWARVPPPLPRWPRRVQLTVASSPVLAFTSELQVRRPHGSFRGCRVHSELISRSYYGPRAG